MTQKELKIFLDKKVDQYNQPFFIADDPISIPHKFTLQQDIEIAGFFAAILAWGNRKSIINSCTQLMNLMQNNPYEFIMSKKFVENTSHLFEYENFVHRTFNKMDLLHILDFLRYHYWFMGEESLQTAFTKWMNPDDESVENALTGFHKYVFSYDEDASEETHCKKHIASPHKKSACKRLNMYLRWMVRDNKTGVDFGLWKNIKPSQLIIPIDVHVSRVSQKLGILNRTQNDWQAATELTTYLKTLDATDPVKYDFALFGLGVMEKF